MRNLGRLWMDTVVSDRSGLASFNFLFQQATYPDTLCMYKIVRPEMIHERVDNLKRVAPRCNSPNIHEHRMPTMRNPCCLSNYDHIQFSETIRSKRRMRVAC